MSITVEPIRVIHCDGVQEDGQKCSMHLTADYPEQDDAQSRVQVAEGLGWDCRCPPADFCPDCARLPQRIGQPAIATTPSPRDPKALIAAGFKQISRKAGLVARLPPGLDGIEALKLVDRRRYQDIVGEIERRCADMYRRGYAQGDDRLTLSPEEMAAFRAVGGESSW